MIKTGETSREVVYLIASLPPERADGRRLLAIHRGHSAIENRLHYVHDWSFDEDSSTIRTGSLPWIMATVRDVAIALLRLAGITHIAAALREGGGLAPPGRGAHGPVGNPGCPQALPADATPPAGAQDTPLLGAPNRPRCGPSARRASLPPRRRHRGLDQSITLQPPEVRPRRRPWPRGGCI